MNKSRLTKKNLYSWLCLLGFFGLLFAIFYGGPRLSKAIDRHDRKVIDENGLVVKAVVYKKKTFKGNAIYFSYSYNGTDYTNHEQNDSLFELFNIRDTVFIKIDTTSPKDSYVVKDATATETLP
jgi:hypothetical protein